MPRFESLCGGCLCGALRYRVGVRPDRIGLCYCRSCRRAAGATPVAWATVPQTSFAWERGAPARHASSAGVERTHCPACGTSLTYAAAGDETLDVTLASFDRADDLAPRRAIWLEDRLRWAPLDPAIPHHLRGVDAPLWTPPG